MPTRLDADWSVPAAILEAVGNTFAIGRRPFVPVSDRGTLRGLSQSLSQFEFAGSATSL
jgi:hypothetical protein